MRISHDEWSKMGEKALGGPEGANIRFMNLHGDDILLVYGGPVTLMKCVLNDYWADAMISKTTIWDKEKIDMVMSKLYYCWVAMIQAQVGEEE